MKKRRTRSGRTGEKIPLAELLSRRFDIPADVLCGGLTVELRGRNDLYITGCERILSYLSLIHISEPTRP